MLYDPFDSIQTAGAGAKGFFGFVVLYVLFERFVFGCADVGGVRSDKVEPRFIETLNDRGEEVTAEQVNALVELIFGDIFGCDR